MSSMTTSNINEVCVALFSQLYVGDTYTIGSGNLCMLLVVDTADVLSGMVYTMQCETSNVTMYLPLLELTKLDNEPELQLQVIKAKNTRARERIFTRQETRRWTSNSSSRKGLLLSCLGKRLYIYIYIYTLYNNILNCRSLIEMNRYTSTYANVRV